MIKFSDLCDDQRKKLTDSTGTFIMVVKKFCKHCGQEFDLTGKSAIAAHLILKLHRSTEHQDIVDRRRTQYETYEERLRRRQLRDATQFIPQPQIPAAPALNNWGQIHSWQIGEV